MELKILGVSVVLFLLILSRWAGFVALAPVLGGKGVPAYIKLGLALACTVVVYPLVSKGHTPPSDPVEYAMAIVQETLVGLTLGFISQKIIQVLDGAGQIIDIQTGLAMGNMLDPINATQAPLTGNFFVILATMILLATNAHHYLIAAMVKSYTYIPLLGGGPNQRLIDFGINFVAGIFTDAVQIALPVAGVLVLTEIAMGFVAKTLPQMNIFLLGFPLKIALGFLLIFWIVPMLSYEMDNGFQDTVRQLQMFFQGWGKP